ncbi:uncharacterized protein LODBEIA_P19320 [Lodderomyces beijingensis]|uniref:RRM domain-containing protein n=1 Tax=Lodderomyces beijingensis TaxID=1775926 RepID=A0ABP0ZHR9_9ASCO
MMIALSLRDLHNAHEVAVQRDPQPSHRRSITTAMPPKSINSSILYVGLIPFDWDEETVKSVVFGSGNIVDVRLGFDYEGKNKGFCFVEYQTTRDAQRAAPLLSSILIYQPNGSSKKLKIEGSKEGHRSSAAEVKRLMNISRTKLPSNVRLPPEMVSGNGRLSSPMPHTPQQQQQRMMTPPQQMGVGPNQQMPTRLTQASRNLPQAAHLPFAKSDKINENLSKLTPPEMIEVLSNVKNFTMSDPGRAQMILQSNPELAIAAAQALLLMGFVDSEVITEAGKSTPQPQSQTLYNQQQPPPPPPQQQAGSYYNGGYGQQYPPQPTQVPTGPGAGSRYPNLPVVAQQRLSSFPPAQADLYAKYLSMTPDEFLGLAEQAKIQIQVIREQFGLPRL